MPAYSRGTPLGASFRYSLPPTEGHGHVERLRQAAAQGDIEAIRELGTRHRFGHDVRQDIVTAADLHVVAALDGDAPSAAQLAEYRPEIENAALGGSVVAALCLARMFDRGLGVRKNRATMLAWLLWGVARGVFDGEADYVEEIEAMKEFYAMILPSADRDLGQRTFETMLAAVPSPTRSNVEERPSGVSTHLAKCGADAIDCTNSLPVSTETAEPACDGVRRRAPPERSERLIAAEDATIRRAIRILESRYKRRGVTLTGPAAVRDYLRLRIADREWEVFVVLFLDAHHRLIAAEEMFRGALTQTSVHPREIVRAALRHNAAAVIFAHNHPSDVAEPSPADQSLTSTLKQALALIECRTLDHLIVTRTQTTSFAEQGLL